MGARLTSSAGGDASGAPAPHDVVCISATPTGRHIAERLPYRRIHGDVAASVRREWDRAGAIVLVLAAGAAVRIVAPLLADKAHDPGVVCVDDSGTFVVALCGGHAGGANALATEVAALLEATPVITTATDRLGIAGLDALPGLRAEGDIAVLTSQLLDGGRVRIDNPLGWTVPPAIVALDAGDDGPAVGRMAITDKVEVEAQVVEAPASHPTVLLRPPSLVVGVGTSSDAEPAELAQAVAEALEAGGLSPLSVAAVATVDRRSGHGAVIALAHRFGVPVTSFAPGDLDVIEVPHPSEVVRRAVGTRSVAEAAALAGAGPGARLVVDKQAGARTTVAVARRARPSGAVSVVGLGPGSAAYRTPAAVLAVRNAGVVVGFSAYIEQCRDLITPAHKVVALPLGTEEERARIALAEAAAGHRVALVSSGDPGIYAMASPLFEMAGDAAAADVEVVPGVTAASAAAAVLGAPLGHDHAVISLSDLLTPWHAIEARLEAAGAADFVVALYNPRSQRRRWQLEAARDILLTHRAGSTPVGIVTDAGRPGQQVILTTLQTLDVDAVTMTTCVIVGATTTRIVGGRMVTPRGYAR